MTALRRFLVLQALMLWQGGFLFYATFVVPAGTRVLGSAAAQGGITTQVTDALNAVGAVGLALVAWDLSVTRDPSARRTAARWWCWAVAFACQYLMSVFHQLLDSFMDPGRTQIVIRPPFRPVHRMYLWASTVQWAACLPLAWLTLRAWVAEATAVMSVARHSVAGQSGPSRSGGLLSAAPTPVGTTPLNASDRSRPGLLLIVLAYVGFVSLGLPDAVIGVAWPTVRDTFGLTQDAVGLVFVASGLGYFVTSFLSGRLTHALGIGLLLAASTALVAAAMFGFAYSPLWVLFVACAVVHGFGSGAIDAGLNGYAAHSLSARHMNWLHACYCFGAMLGPLLMTAVLTNGRSYSTGYTVVGGVMLTLTVVFLATWPRWGEASATAGAGGPRVGVGDALRHPTVLLQMVLFFLYTGLEMALSQWAYTVLTESRGVDPTWAGYAAGAYWGCIGAGRVVFGLIADRVGIDRLLRWCLLAAAAGAVLFAVLPGGAGVVGLALAGVGLAPVFPCLMTRTPQRLGTALSAHAIGFQVGAAMIGAAVVPATLGRIAGVAGLEAIPVGVAVLAGVVWLLHEVLVRRPVDSGERGASAPRVGKDEDSGG